MTEPQKAVLKSSFKNQLAGTQKMINHVASWMVKIVEMLGGSWGIYYKQTF